MGQNGIDFVLGVLFLGQNLPGLDLGNDLVDKRKPFAVSRFNGGLIRQIDIPLMIRRFLPLTIQGSGGLHDFCQPIPGGGGGIQYRTAQFLGQGIYINFGFLLLVDVMLVQRHNHRNTQLQQLGGEKQRTAQIGGIHNVDDGIGVLVSDIGAGDALLRGKGRHGVSAGQIHGNQLLRTCVSLFNQRLFLVHGNTGPVAYLFIASGQGVVHGGFTAVGIACKSNSHFGFPPLSMVILSVFFLDSLS